MGGQSCRPRYGVRQEAAGQVVMGLVEGFKEWNGGGGGEGRFMTVVERGRRPNRCCGGISGGEGLKNQGGSRVRWSTY